jgi:hypothetical protein
MIVTGLGARWTRLGLIDVGVPRCICWRLVRTRASFFIGGDAMGTCRSKDRRYKTVRGCFAGIEMGLKKCATGIVTRFHLSKPSVRN